jgi:hypothetical protein
MKKQLVLRNNGTDKTPYARAPARSVTRVTARTAKWKQRFLRALRQSPSVKDACRVAGVSRKTAYAHRKLDEVFAERWQETLEGAVDDLEVVAFKRAAEGDSQVLTFLLRCHRPAIYRDVARMEIDTRLCGVIMLPQKEDLPP